MGLPCSCFQIDRRQVLISGSWPFLNAVATVGQCGSGCKFLLISGWKFHRFGFRFQRMEEAAQFIKQRLPGFRADWGVILGSGLNDLVEKILDPQVVIDYADIPGFPQPTASGHHGRLVLGKVVSGPDCFVACFQGRFHFYEGHAVEDVVLPVNLSAMLGARGLLVTNAAGGIRADLAPGAIMLIRDHINFLGTNPLIGCPVSNDRPRHVDMSYAYDPKWREETALFARNLNIPLRTGVYIAVPGPAFETPAEINAFRVLGADAVGMSTVPEVIVARQLGMRVAGLSCITNAAAGLGDGEITGEEVMANARLAHENLARLIPAMLTGLPLR